MHVKLMIQNNKMDICLNNMSQPMLHVHDLKRDLVVWGIRFYSLLRGAYYANLTYQEIEQPALIGDRLTISEFEKDVLLDWEVSKVFDKKDLQGVVNLRNYEGYSHADWNAAAAEYDGKLNFAKVAMKIKEKKSIFAKTTMHANKKQMKKLSFGCSDDVVICVNNKIVYSEHHRFRS